LYWFSDWGKVSLTLQVYQSLACRKVALLPNWQKIVGQSMYLKDHEKMGINRGVSVMVSYRKAGIPTIVQTETKKAVVQSLEASNGQLSNGLFSLLARNGLVEQFSWACRQETHTHTI
jgi:hypothetical protein